MAEVGANSCVMRNSSPTIPTPLQDVAEPAPARCPRMARSRDGQSALGVPLGEGRRTDRHRCADRVQRRRHGALPAARRGGELGRRNRRCGACDAPSATHGLADLGCEQRLELSDSWRKVGASARKRSLWSATPTSTPLSGPSPTSRSSRSCRATRPSYRARARRRSARRGSARPDVPCHASVRPDVGRTRSEARTIADEVVAAAEATGVPSSIALAWLAKGEALAETDPAAALSAYEHAAALARQSGNRLFLTMIVPKMAAMLCACGDMRAALRGFQEMLESSVGSRELASSPRGSAI